LIELHQRGRRVVVLIDEAHAMPLESLEEIRLLSNLETHSSKLLQIVLFGQPELDAHLALKHMRQLKERITQSFKLEPLLEGEVNQYLNFRLRAAGYRGPDLFDARCTKLLTRASQGLSRRINIIADKSMLAAFADDTHDIEPGHVKAAIRDGEFQIKRHHRPHPWVLASFSIFGAILGGILVWVFTHKDGKPALEAVAPAASQPASTAYASPPAKEVNPVGPAVTRPAATTASLDAIAAPRDAPAPQPTGPEMKQQPTAAASTVATAAMQQPAPPPANAVDGTAAWQASHSWMQAQPTEHWVIQLMLSNFSDAGERGAFVAQATAMLGEEKLHQYALQLSGNKKIGVLYGPFADRREAQRALTALPSSLKQYQPYMRTIGVVRQEAIYN
jgi:MSHA biogenesis protein MshM